MSKISEKKIELFGKTRDLNKTRTFTVNVIEYVPMAYIGVIDSEVGENDEETMKNIQKDWKLGFMGQLTVPTQDSQAGKASADIKIVGSVPFSPSTHVYSRNAHADQVKLARELTRVTNIKKKAERALKEKEARKDGK